MAKLHGCWGFMSFPIFLFCLNNHIILLKSKIFPLKYISFLASSEPKNLVPPVHIYRIRQLENDGVFYKRIIIKVIAPNISINSLICLFSLRRI